MILKKFKVKALEKETMKIRETVFNATCYQKVVFIYPEKVLTEDQIKQWQGILQGASRINGITFVILEPGMEIKSIEEI